MIRASGLKVHLHAYGTNVEGDLETILSTIKRIHETLHAEGTQRLSTTIKIGTRTDKDANLEGKLFDSGCTHLAIPPSPISRLMAGDGVWAVHSA